MYALTFMYPEGTDHQFDVKHFLEVHLPMGLYLTRKHLGIQPLHLTVLAPARLDDVAPGSAPYAALSTCFFATEQEVITFSRLFEVEEAACLLSNDFLFYTFGAPDVLISKVISLNDVDELISRHPVVG